MPILIAHFVLLQLIIEYTLWTFILLNSSPPAWSLRTLYCTSAFIFEKQEPGISCCCFFKLFISTSNSFFLTFSLVMCPWKSLIEVYNLVSTPQPTRLILSVGLLITSHKFLGHSKHFCTAKYIQTLGFLLLLTNSAGSLEYIRMYGFVRHIFSSVLSSWSCIPSKENMAVKKKKRSLMLCLLFLDCSYFLMSFFISCHFAIHIPHNCIQITVNQNASINASFCSFSQLSFLCFYFKTHGAILVLIREIKTFFKF